MKTSFAMLTLISGLALAGCGPKAATGSDTSSSDITVTNEGQPRDAVTPAPPETPAVTNLPANPGMTNMPPLTNVTVMPIETNAPDTNATPAQQ